MKKQRQPAPPSISGSVLKPLIDRHKQAVERELTPPTIVNSKLDGEADYQDSGAGYNTDFVIPQK